MNEVLKEKVKNSDEPLLVVEDRSVFYIFGGLFLVLLFIFFSIMMFLANSIFLKIIGILILIYGLRIFLDLLVFEKMAIYENHISIERNFLKDIKIKIEDISMLSLAGGHLILSTITIYIKKKNILGFKSYIQVNALSGKDEDRVKKAIETQITKINQGENNVRD